MLYVLDTNSIKVLAGYYPKTFPTFWDQFNALVSDGRIVSVEEVRKELEFLLRSAHLIEWVERQDIFTPPNGDEMRYVNSIFAVEHFRPLINERAIALGRPVADPWLIARAMDQDACVVTEETHKPNAAKIPNVCDHFGIEHMKLQDMLAEEGWRF